ncbi:hypothetical protein quinque_009742 [Culex quinquefasciatus]
MQQQHHDDDVRTQPPQLQNVNQEHIVTVIKSEEKQKVINEKRTIYNATIIEITFVCMQLDHVSDHERSNYGQFPIDPRRSTPIDRMYYPRTPFKSGHDQ